jgi:plastocyanin
MKNLMIVLGIALALTAAACGGDDEDVAAPPETPAATGPTGTTAQTGPTGATGDECVDLTGEGATFTIVMSRTEFVPECFTASASQGITIVNEDQLAHTFTIEGTMIDVQVNAGDEFQGEPISGVAAPGTYELICRFHPFMTGEVTIVA